MKYDRNPTYRLDLLSGKEVHNGNPTVKWSYFQPWAL